jgi:hypothetical protein
MYRRSARIAFDFRYWHKCEVPTGSGKCLLAGVDRTYRGHHETNASEPEAEIADCSAGSPRLAGEDDGGMGGKTGEPVLCPPCCK